MSDSSSGLKKLLDDYLERSSTASAIARNLGLAGIAIIWIFKKNAPNGITLPPDLVSPLIWLIIFLIIDFLHYFIGTIIGGISHRLAAKEVELGELKESEVEFPEWLSIANWVVWGAKMIPFFWGYCLLLIYLFKITNSGA